MNTRLRYPALHETEINPGRQVIIAHKKFTSNTTISVLADFRLHVPEFTRFVIFILILNMIYKM